MLVRTAGLEPARP